MRINDMALNSRFGGSFAVNRDMWNRDFLLLHFRTPAIVILNGKEVQAEEGSFIIFHVGTPQKYYAAEATYSDDYIHFFIDDDYNFIKELGIPFNKVLQIPKVNLFPKLLANLQHEYISIHKNKDITIDLLLKQLFIKMSEFVVNDQEDYNYFSYYDTLQRLRAVIYSNPEKNWTVPEMAKYCNLSSSYLQTLYKQAFHTTCINDVINSKMQQAKSLLVMTKYTVKEIAFRCGYQNVEYFMRQFKKYTGHTPTEYRSFDYSKEY